MVLDILNQHLLFNLLAADDFSTESLSCLKGQSLTVKHNICKFDCQKGWQVFWGHDTIEKAGLFWHDRIWTPTLEFHLSKELKKLLLRLDRDAPRVRIFQNKWNRCFCWCKGTNVQFKEKLSARSNIAVFCFSNLFLAFDKRIETYKAVQMCVLQY